MSKEDYNGYKIIDIDIKGNTVRYYLAKDKSKIKESWGDDWNDTPYEHNAGEVYREYVEKIMDVFYPYDMIVTEPCDDWHYHGNSPFCKEDFKKRRAPRVCIFYPDEPWGFNSYSDMVGNDTITKIYYGDDIEKAWKDSVYYMEVEAHDTY